jgi:exonuclease III
LKKISSITSCNSDIIFLSDLRLGNNAAVPDLIRIFRTNCTGTYDFYFNSTKNKRGVGILIKKDLPYNIVRTDRDVNENILSITFSLQDYVFKCISIYGPNSNDREFFSDLERFINSDPNIPLIAGGDWNLTYSILNSQANIDIINMPNPPSIFRSRLLYEICSASNLIDPYRLLYPDKRDYSYIPRAGTDNRSRLDFFLISNSIAGQIKDAGIHPNLGTLLFDHKPIFLSFK